MHHSLILALIVVAGVLGAGRAVADCTDGGCLPGGGPDRTDCMAAFRAPKPNFPFFDPTRVAPKPAKELRCFDGDAGCDVDGETDGVCTFPVDVCLAAPDPARPGCGAGRVDKVAVKVKRGDGGTLAADVAALVPATEAACSSGGRVAVRMKPRRKGGFRPAKALVRVTARGENGKDTDKMRVRCLPREWPTHGFDPQNRRASPMPTRITPATVNDLRLKWELNVGSSVTSTPTVGHGLVYVTSWNGVLYAVKAKNGKVKWEFDTGTAVVAGIKGSATVTADGRVLIADGFSNVHCLDAKKGTLLWTRNLGAPPVDHIWASVQTAPGRAYIGVAALLDDPPAPGVLYALDLDTGEIIWSFRAVPDRICRSDSQIECTTSDDCPFGGACIEGLGAAITATVALDPTATQLYMNPVGSQTFPSIGDSDSVLRFDAATGEVVWRNRVNEPEQFGLCDGDTSIECSTGSACGAFAPCTPKFRYHDFGFLNGPMLVDDGAGGTLVVSGSKDGSIYAFDPDTGALVWRNEILPEPVSPSFAAFGLFNGAIGAADGRIHATLYGFLSPSTDVAEHFKTFAVSDGDILWEDAIGPSWGDVGIAGGVVYAGTQAVRPAPDPDRDFYAYDAATGTRLRTFDMKTNVTGGATVVGDMLFIPYGGLLTDGGVQAWRLR